MKLYPIEFIPILKERIWGGTKLHDLLNKEVNKEGIGESWELSNVLNDVSIVKNGFLKGKDLNEIIHLYPEAILGEKVIAKYGKNFPLLFKFIDAKEDLSIQVHPNDLLAKERHNSFGKTEMWYVMQADPESRLVVGFKEDSSKETYVSCLKNKTLLSILEEYPVEKGDVFFLETGIVHAIGAGVLIAEIQQTSDITYRLYDWDRVDVNGNGRELHTELALDAINFKKTSSKVAYSSELNESSALVSCPYFTTHVLELEGAYHWEKNKEAFTVFMCVEGQIQLIHEEIEYVYNKGQTVFIPAEIERLQLKGTGTLLEISI